MYIQLLSLGWGLFHLHYSKFETINYLLYCINCIALPVQCLSTHPWWTFTYSTLQRPISRSTRWLGSSLGRDWPSQRGLTRFSNGPSLRMDMNTAAGTHTPMEMGMGMANPDCIAVRTDMWEDAFRKQSMDRYCVKSLKCTMCTVITSWSTPPGVLWSIIGVKTSGRKFSFTTGIIIFTSPYLLSLKQVVGQWEWLI